MGGEGKRFGGGEKEKNLETRKTTVVRPAYGTLLNKNKVLCSVPLFVLVNFKIMYLVSYEYCLFKKQYFIVSYEKCCRFV